MSRSPKLTPDQALEFWQNAPLSYVAETGLFHWENKIPHFNVAGNAFRSKIIIKYKDQNISAHRLIWIKVFGREPLFFVAHINGNKLDNRLINLRETPVAMNRKSIDARIAKKLTPEMHKRIFGFEGYWDRKVKEIS